MKNATKKPEEGSTKSEGDPYQTRYLLHQQHGKKQELIAIMEERHSNRRFSEELPDTNIIHDIIDSTKHCPSSCDRHGVKVKIIVSRDNKALLNGLLVGGIGWLYRAPIVLMLFADFKAYKGGEPAGDEINYNALLDAGVMLQQMSLYATYKGLHTAFCNPQIRRSNKEFFYSRFKPRSMDNALFCGAIALGYPHKKKIKKKRNLDNLNMIVD